MGGVREQEIHRWRLERRQRGVGRDRVVADVDRAQEPRVELSVPVCAEQSDSADHLVVAAAPVTVTAVQVVTRAISVERDADPDPGGQEDLAQLLVEPHPVGVNSQIERADGGERAIQLPGDLGQLAGARQQRLAAVQYDPHPRQGMLPRVLGDAFAGFRDGFTGN